MSDLGAIEGTNSVDDARLLLLSSRDNVFVARENIAAGQTLSISGHDVVLVTDILRGHKLARHAIAPGDKILKYGAPIGSAVRPIGVGEHVHVHNVKSDYTATHVIERKAAQP